MLQIVWQGPRVSQTLCFYWPRLSTAGHVLSAHAHNSLSVGKDRQRTRELELDSGH